LDPKRASEKISGFVRHLGADLVRIGPLNPAFIYIYTHVGKGRAYRDRKTGAPITLSHKNAISIAVGLNQELIKTGPVLAEIIEVLRVYGQLASISVAVAGYIRAVGYSARAHNIFNYQVLYVPMAIDAGMGELGRNGLLIKKDLGSCLKLATVSTDLSLTHDPPVDIGIDEFCQDCRICAEVCPSGSIPFREKKLVRGVKKWCITPEPCFKIWNETGTDSGVCVASCPWTKPKTPFHNFAKEIAYRKMKVGWWMSRAEKFV
jgi:reductive dehalogenase